MDTSQSLSSDTMAWIVLWTEVGMGLLLLLGWGLARRKNFKLHGICQSLVVILNLIVIGAYMWPVFRRSVLAGFHFEKLSSSFYYVSVTHAFIGALAELLGIYVLLVAGLRILPKALSFQRYKLWMRTALALWWLAILAGLATFSLWRFDVAAKGQGQLKAQTPGVVTIAMKNFEFAPKVVQVQTGTTVRWTGMQGNHTVKSDDGRFESDVIPVNGEFSYRFDVPGTFNFYCALHGEAGLKDMAGTVIVSR